MINSGKQVNITSAALDDGSPASEPSGSNVHDHYFGTDHLLTNLRGRTVSSGFITGVAQGTQLAMNLTSIVVLARMLMPWDFGLLAMVTTVTGFLRIFNEAGLSTATVQRQNITHAQVSNLFWVNVALGGTVTLLLAALAPAIAWFYREPRLVGITLALCITFLLTGSTVQHMALLKRQMRFRMIAVIQIAATFASVVVGIGMAAFDCGYWSLVGAQLTLPALTFLLTWLASPWRPQLPQRKSGTRSLLGFGANLTVSSFLWSLARGSDGLLIGRLYGSASLGLYSRAQALLLRPLEQLIAPLEAVFVPTLSRLQTQPDRYRRIVFQVLEAIAVVSFVFTGLLLPLAHPLTLVVLGSKWEHAAPVFAAFTLVAVYTPVASVASWLLASQGRGKDFLLISSIGSIATVASFAIGALYGPAGVAFAYSILSLLVLLPMTYYIAGRRGPVSTKDLWIGFIKHLPVWVVVAAATWLVRTPVIDRAPLLQLGICIPAGLLAGCGFIFAYSPARRTALNLYHVLRDWKNSRRTAGG